MRVWFIYCFVVGYIQYSLLESVHEIYKTIVYIYIYMIFFYIVTTVFIYSCGYWFTCRKIFFLGNMTDDWMRHHIIFFITMFCFVFLNCAVLYLKNVFCMITVFYFILNKEATRCTLSVHEHTSIKSLHKTHYFVIVIKQRVVYESYTLILEQFVGMYCT